MAAESHEVANTHPCERSLAKKFRDQAFAIVGVYVGKSARLRESIKTEEVTWPCILQNIESKTAPSVEWGVRVWPANFLIDSKGVVRVVNEFNEEKLAFEIARLLDESQ